MKKARHIIIRCLMLIAGIFFTYPCYGNVVVNKDLMKESINYKPLDDFSYLCYNLPAAAWNVKESKGYDDIQRYPSVIVNEGKVFFDFKLAHQEISSSNNIPWTGVCNNTDEGRCELVEPGHLFLTVNAAKSNEPQDICFWNSTLDLSKLVELHYTADEGSHKRMDAETMKAIGLEFKFELTSLILGENLTDESAHANIQGTTFRPQPADENGQQQVYGAEQIRNLEVGRTPIVRVPLIDKVSGDVLDYGYIRIKIVESGGGTQPDVPDQYITYIGGGYTYNGEGEGWSYKTTWNQTEWDLYNLIDATREEWESNYGGPVKGDDGNLQQYEMVSPGVFTVAKEVMGKIYEFNTSENGSVIRYIEWTLTSDEAFNYFVINKEKVPYGRAIKYESADKKRWPDVYVMFTTGSNVVINYTFSIQSSSGGSVNFNGTTVTDATRSFSVSDGFSATITITPNSGFRLASLIVNGTNVTSSIINNQYTISNITANTVVVATFEQIFTPVTVTLTEPSSINYTNVKLGATLGGDYQDVVTSYGIFIAKTIEGLDMEATSTKRTDSKPTSDSFSYTFSYLEEGATYYYCAFAQVNGAYVYSDTLSVTLLTHFPVPEYVDLGLSVKWAKWNMGASSDKEVGGYYGWGDNTGSLKSNYNSDYAKGNTSTNIAGTNYDLAYVKWGGKWRMPTQAEYDELVTKCTWTFTRNYEGTGISGYIVNGKPGSGMENNSIFFPRAGYETIKGTKMYWDSDADYWTSECQEGSVKAYFVTLTGSALQKHTSDKNVMIPIRAIYAEATSGAGSVDYSLSIQSGSGGSVTFNGTTITNTTRSFTVNEGSSATLTISPNSGYRLASLTVNGTDVTSDVSNNSYTISKITTNITVVATFEEIPSTTYSVSVQAKGNGTVYFNSSSINNTTKTFSVKPESSAIISFLPDSGFKLTSLVINGTNVTSNVSNNRYTISNITENTTIVATFEQIPVITYTLSIQSSSGGSITYNGTTITNATRSFTVNEGSSATLTISPNSGYRLASLTVNGTNRTSSVSNSQYTISNITANTTVVATFEQIAYALSVQASGNGTLTYAGTDDIKNDTRTFTVNHGSSVSLTITPDTGYRLASLVVNGTNVTSSVTNNKYTINNISANTTVVATFTQITYTLSVQASGSGTLTYAGTDDIKNTTRTFTVGHGSSVSLTITPDNGYRLVSLTVNGTNVTSGVSNNQYTINSVTANTTVVAVFEEIPPTIYTFSIQVSNGGYVSYNNTTISNTTQSFNITEGTSATITITANSGYKLSTLTVNGTNVTSSVKNNQYTISNISSNTTVVVSFAENLQSFTAEGINYQMVSAANKTLNVSSGNYSGHVIIPASVSYEGETWSVRNAASGVFNNAAITAITWNPKYALSSNAFDSQTNPNLLLYVQSASYAPSNVQNVIANGNAKKIVLTDAASGNDFDCPESFTTEEISYTHKYNMTTGINESRGWETIALPFDVKLFTHETKGTLIPFKVYSSTSSGKPFWLYQLSSNGWQEASSIEANSPYIISMPNNDAYDRDYILAGTVTFSSKNVTVPRTQAITVKSGERSFVANFKTQAPSWGIYALNVNNDYSSYTDYLPEGSSFIRELRTVHPFEAYITTSANNAKAYIPVFEELPTAIVEIPITGFNGKQGLRIYTLAGNLVLFSETLTLQEALKRLPRGVYIINGKKLAVK